MIGHGRAKSNRLSFRQAGVTDPGYNFRGYKVAYCFFSRSSNALVIPMIAVRMVDSGTGRNLLECSDGKGVPLFFDSATFAGSTAPTLICSAGIE